MEQQLLRQSIIHLQDAVPAIPNEDVKSNHNQTFEMPEDTKSKPVHDSSK